MKSVTYLGVIPFHKDIVPSSFAIKPIACTIPVYFGALPGLMTCFCILVFTTSSGLLTYNINIWNFGRRIEHMKVLNLIG